MSSRAMPETLVFPNPVPPKPGEAIEIRPGVLWARFPLPFRLDHVNVYLIEDGDGLALIDAGIDNPPSRAAWEALNDFTRTYTQSQYLEDAKKKQAEIRDRLVRHEVYVADFYEKRDRWVAAASRLEIDGVRRAQCRRDTHPAVGDQFCARDAELVDAAVIGPLGAECLIDRRGGERDDQSALSTADARHEL